MGPWALRVPIIGFRRWRGSLSPPPPHPSPLSPAVAPLVPSPGALSPGFVFFQGCMGKIFEGALLESFKDLVKVIAALRP